MYKYEPKGVCTKELGFEVEDEKVKDVYFIGGCDGNLKGISSLVEGMNIDDVIDRLEGITCGKRNTSCPDQFSKALVQYKEENNL